ncbi:UDP-galactose transporter [Smittium culicis]|uniref:UDP-galactose transporter n=1 Tax=Smittium culicis TaxID=133412 RepID=A0A1R1XGK2_9FUNG|nr:UDP-galactose transporter [Smittium culicis]OMJ13754.1 UDP-galactose transporter [Smittium culicis]
MEKKIFGISIKYLSLLVLVVQNSMLVIVMRYSRVVSDIKYFSSTAVFFAELFKLVSSCALYYNEDSHLINTNGIGYFFHQVFGTDSWKMVIPAFLYTLQNNLQYRAVSLLDPATFQVSYQMKILTTALFSVVLLKTILGAVKWSSLLMLTAGIALVQLDSSSASTASSTPSAKMGTIKKFEGLVAVGIACLLSGLSGVYFELVLKTTKKSVWLRNLQLSIYSLIPATIGILLVDGSEISQKGFFYGYTIWTFGSIMCQSLGGLVVAVVVKYADNILKGFATSISIILSCILSIWIFDFKVTLTFTLGTILVVYSTYLYGTVPDKRKAPLTNDENEYALNSEIKNFDNHSSSSSKVLQVPKTV